MLHRHVQWRQPTLHTSIQRAGSPQLSDLLERSGRSGSVKISRNCAIWPYDNWSLIEQIPFEPNLAFTYNAGPDGVFHSAPTTELLLDNAVPTHERAVIIFRFRYK